VELSTALRWFVYQNLAAYSPPRNRACLTSSKGPSILHRRKTMSVRRKLFAAVVTAVLPAAAFAQSTPGAGNANAVALAQKSPIVQSAYAFVIKQARSLHGDKLRRETLDAIANPHTCVEHRAGVDATKKAAILQQLKDAGLVNP